MKKLNWVLFISRRFSLVDRKGSGSVTTRISILGICFGVMTLIAVMSVMNGFQAGFINSIMEISSYHVRVSEIPQDKLYEVNNYLQTNEYVNIISPMIEAQCLMDNDGQAAAFIRAVDKSIYKTDEGFAKEMKIISGSFDLSEPQSIVLGSRLANSIQARVGEYVNLLALSGSSDTSLFSNTRLFKVTGIFHCGYADINSSYSFISLEDGRIAMGDSAPLIFSIKLKNQNLDSKFISQISQQFPSIKTESWRDYNRSFFGALRVEKNMLLFLVVLIFVVVGINIFNSMHRLVYERRPEISTLSALGGSTKMIQGVFVLRGFLTGLEGGIPGLALGLLISVQIKKIFSFLSLALYYAQLFISMIFNPEAVSYISENPMYRVYASIPAKINFSEVALITLFGIFSSTVASYIASRNVLKMNISEVLHEE